MANLAERFAAKFSPEPMSGCWLWFGAVNDLGYGKIWDGKFVAMAHRVSYQLFNGTIDPGKVVCHRCDTPACVNPKHLFLGSQLENMRDKHAKNRHFTPREENSALTADQVRRIRMAPKGTLAALAEELGMSYGGAYKIFRGDRWGHLNA